ncbi:Lethal(2) giant larvae sro7 [Coemansia brasiliensis]|uniref:Lethal(2) giant larvae sro7 n=1 Tax=Coemansia brasiliensis TaxID=2650707 RepID=A0A9W8LZ80_9FUNG|nr:Lethal(2) giant larvae sro7 [Coemansia brasiliensis]
MPNLRIIEDLQVDPVTNATATAFDPIQKVLAVGYSNGSIRLFFAQKYTASTPLQTNGTSAITHVRFITGHAALVCIDYAGVLRVFDLDTLGFCFDYQVPMAPTCISSFAGTSWVLVGTEGGRVYFVDCVNGYKSDYSIGCLAKPVSPVAAVETHPLETEKILIAYVNGTTVVCDLGKASISERAMTLGKYTYESPLELMAKTSGVWILDAGWSPTGDKIAVSYSNGVIAVFESNGGSTKPIVVRTIQCPDIQSPENIQEAAANMPSKLSCLGTIRWCLHGQTDRSFLVVTSGSTAKLQSYIHILSTNGKNVDIKCSQNIVLEDSIELPASLLSISTITSSSPWRNGNDGVVELTALVGQRAFVQKLFISPDLHIHSGNLPGELKWSIVPAVQQFAVEGTLSTVLNRALLCSATAGSTVPASSNGALSQLYCCIDDASTLSFWCTVDQRLCHCDDVSLNLDSLFRMVGTEGQITSVHLCALSGLLAIGTDSGETFLCLLTTDRWESLAQQYTPITQLHKLALQYYSMRPRQPQRPTTTQSTRPHSTQVDSADQQHLGLQRHRSASLHDGGVFKRKSKRLSSSFGTLFRRGSSASGHLRENSKHKADATNAVLSRDTNIDAMAWKQQLNKLALEMTPMVYGLQFDPRQQQLISGNTLPTDADKSYLSMDISEQKNDSLQLFIRPFMLARFVYCPVVKVVTSEHGLVAIAYSNGTLVVVDAIGQKVVLADNINLSPKANSASVSDLFGAANESPVVITTMVFAAIGSGSQMSLLVGTSCGHIYQYADFEKPPILVATAPESPIIYLTLEPADGTANSQLLVVGTVGSITLHQFHSTGPVATFQPSDSKAQILSMRVVHLPSGWHGIAAIIRNNGLAMVSLPDLTEKVGLKLPSSVERLLHAADACIGAGGQIQVLGPGGRLAQLHVTDAVAELTESSSMQQEYYDNSLKPPPQPVRKGITSWLLGKATDPTADIDAFLGSHHRDLLAQGGTKPGARLHNNMLQLETEDPPALSKRSRQDSKLGEIDKSLDMGEIAETQELLERRGQQLEEVSQAMDQLSLQSEGFLKKIRAYNAEQEKKSKRRFGLF